MTAATLSIGSVVGETYTLEEQIGRGGMGVVFLASHNRLPGKRVAIKMLHAEAPGGEALARFRREADIASLLAHPNIVRIEDYNVTPDGTPYLVLEYLQGESLAQRLARGPLPLEQTMSIVRQIGSALAAAHAKGIVHRDLKPQNIFLVPSEVDGRPMEIAKVLDFGISKMIDAGTLQTDENAFLGTPQYMAPEQATGKHGAIDFRADVFALGAIVYEMLAGVPAFRGATIPEIVFKVVYEEPEPLPAHVAAAIALAVHQAMAKQATARFASVGSFVEALTGNRITSAAAAVVAPSGAAAALAPTVDSTQVPRVDLAPEPAPSPSRPLARRVGLGVAAVVLAAGAASAAYLLLGRGGERTPHIDREIAESVAAQLPTGPEVMVQGRAYHVVRGRLGLRSVIFEIDGHTYEAIEQNPEKQSRNGALAREGHHVVDLKDPATDVYLGVVIDGKVEHLR